MRPLTTTDVARRPLPGSTVPTSIRFSPDGSTLTFLLAEAGSLRQRLVAVDVDTGRRRDLDIGGTEVDEDALGLEERLRRERARELAVGVTRYAWAASAERLLVPMGDGIWVVDGADASPRRVLDAAQSPGPVLDAQISADGSTVGWVSGDEVHVVPADGGDAVQVTTGARGTGRTNGLAEYIAQEEMGRPYGFWLSPDGARVAFCEVDETHIPVYRIMHQGSEAVGPEAQEDHRYPFAGAENATVRLGVVAADGTDASRPRWLDLGCTGIGPDRYLARVDWAGPDVLLVQVQDRSQERLDLIRFDLTAGGSHGTLVLRETSTTWINLHDLLRPLPDGGFLWASERSGFRHLEVRDADGSLRHELTSGDWVVTDVAGVGDAEVWFVATAEDGLERHLHRVGLDGSVITRLSGESGVHRAVAHVPSGSWVDVHSTPRTPPVVHLRRSRHSAGDVLLHDAADDPMVAELDLAAPELRTITAADGTTPLHAAVYRPSGAGPFPTVIWVYGGPHAQLVTASWAITTAMRAQYLRQEGFCVAVVDNRGANDRGLAFEGSLRRRMGTVEVDDQVALVRTLVDVGLADPDRIGIYGWSYGGYLSALCLARRPDVFRAACAGAPVTSWDGYDTHYTERYMGTPADNPDGYRDASVMTHVAGMADRHLLLVHGLIDENVHFRHTARLLDALVHLEQTEQVDHRLLLYPNERHVPRAEADRVSMEQHIARFFRETLLSDATNEPAR